jgi:hypothetical protein
VAGNPPVQRRPWLRWAKASLRVLRTRSPAQVAAGGFIVLVSLVGAVLCWTGERGVGITCVVMAAAALTPFSLRLNRADVVHHQDPDA